MYVQQKFQETRLEVLHGLIREQPLGAIVTMTQAGLDASHMPFHLDASVAPYGVLRAHMPRANPLWKEACSEALVIFQGPQGYISPSWYPSKHAHGQAVPTWNYAVVHAYGTPRFVEDRGWLLQNVTELTNTHEGSQQLPWRVSDAPAEYVDKLLGQIVGIEIVITRLQGKWKMSQNRPPADRLGVIAGLTATDDAAASAVQELVSRYHDAQNS